MYGELATGGMASVHLGRLVGPSGFSLVVAIKRLLPMIANDPAFVAMFADEARIASRIRHPNVVPTLDVIEERGELFIAMEYVHGESLARLLHAAAESNERPPVDIAVRIACDMLQGLHAAHEARNERGELLHIVHRDVSPQNVLVGADGIARVMDFGIAKIIDQSHVTRPGEVKGKMRWVAPEQLAQSDVDRRADVYSAGIVTWELLTGKPMRPSVELPQLVTIIARGKIEPPSLYAPDVPPEVEAVVVRALELDPIDRWAYAAEMATALSNACAPASHERVAEWVRELASPALAERAALVRDVESASPPEDVSASAADRVRPRRAWISWLVPLVALGVVAAALATRAGRARRDTNAELPSATPAIGASASTSATESAPLVSTRATPLASSATRVSGVTPALHGSHTHAVPAHAPRDCRIPYVIDSTGVRVPRPECL